ncbi:endonuclease MutS2 [Bacteroides fragilis]|jgi:DNA mismatch repair protein MutS2|uniref:endonuclease MutS2 n=1 Tax=Bacteroides fragilis TaxID=817 RepID=UPI000EBBDB9E|nr:Smr/MutS family protein [Bacteroides fragilis]MCS2209845.1 Smr/MutS family protein [Bacteroides fragilis]MCS2251164.1 Smr/MutS family protein [Bacteroides fragilis]MCY1130327.1 Smr/MutS family protein [Bacteroides fragilis]RGJ14144.1 endonuclease MutS2 [Bacteroides fragilis]RHM86537.1 endonuclease MutS2 [Bacteroides fragilis]
MIYPQNFEQKIGFDQIRQLLKDKCLSTLGEERVNEMNFSDHFEEVDELLNQVAEFVRIIQEEDNFPDQFFFDVRPSLKRIRIEGMYMDEQELFDLRRSLETIRDIIRFLQRNDEEESDCPYPSLKKLAGDITVFPQLITKIDGILNKYGKIKDNASTELSRIRRELANTMGSISRSLNSILRNAQSEGYVDKDVAPTMRDGRLVIPVAPGLKRKIKGIVHDESASGKTVFIEPAEVVEANNRIRELEGDERREIIRILTEFSNTLRPSIPEILQSYEFLAEIDFIRAKSHFAIQTNSIKPSLENEQLLDWTMAVHPLLQLSLAKHGKKVVPLDIELNLKRRILIISGPNAGGKSVCLKTVGLLQYMLQCGMLVPMHERSHVGLFGSIFIDIGDEQSIEDDLSTYSSHLTNMKIMMKNCNERSLILIDEFGGGTEPQIGGAIAEAVLKRFNIKGTFGVITTHYQNLKHFAEDHEGVVNGAMLYDRHLMQALFQLQIGNPGSSFAVEIARKIGLPEDVIADASEIVGSEYINADKYLQDIVRDKRYWEGKRQTIRQREKHMEETIARYQAEMEELQKSRKEIIRQAKEEAERLLQESNARIENTIRTIKEAQAEKEKTRLVRQELADFRESIDNLTSKEQEDKIARKMEKLKEKQNRKKEKKQNGTKEQPAVQQTPKATPITEGCPVRIKGQSSVGEVLEINGKNAVVAFGSIKTTVKTERLERSNAIPQKQESAKSSFVSNQTQDSMYEKKLNFKQDIDVRGMRGDEALQAVTYFVDDAILVGMSRVRILHGTGTGILRTLIRQYLQTIPGVRHFADEHIQLGGAGITVVDLA